MTEPAQPTPPPEPVSSAPPPPTPPTHWTPPEPTPGPAPGVEFADLGARLVGYIIDNLIIAAGAVILSLIGAVLFFGVPILAVIFWLAAIIFGVAYFPYFWSRQGSGNGQTPGMRIMGIRVVRDIDGGPVTGGMAILRFIGYIVSQIVFYIGFIWVFVDKRRRGWFDLIAGTVVIKA
jgi:uncharacterized RDD family membrane protein YckC